MWKFKLNFFEIRSKGPRRYFSFFNDAGKFIEFVISSLCQSFSNQKNQKHPC